MSEQATAPRSARPPAAGGLEVADLCVSFGLHRVLDGCSIAVAPGEVVALVGHNGAGKTTLLRAIMGLARAHRGTIRHGGVPLDGEPPERRAARGVALVPDVSRGGVFADLSVRDNLRLAEDVAGQGPALPEELLRELFPHIHAKADQPTSELSGGQRQMVALALALKRRPVTLLLDEPSVGLAPMVVRDVMSAVRQVTDTTGVGVLLVEQNVPAASRIADRVAILKSGSVAQELAPDEITDVQALWKHF